MLTQSTFPGTRTSLHTITSALTCSDLLSPLTRFLFQGGSSQFLLFLAEVLASFPYSYEEEPLYIIHTINRVLSLLASPVTTYLKPLFNSPTLPPAGTGHCCAQHTHTHMHPHAHAP